ncbi:MAG: hypothetical protein CMN77_04590 [Spirochaetaceae bacterium]|nr:hypothetical protein [Spirochaetaceae bacterium]|tara:strand:- start:10671 stop:11732 length:1062 start_codon:yes stop_codon:yes gene_type:complete
MNSSTNGPKSPDESFWHNLEETQKLQDEIMRQSGDDPDKPFTLLPATQKRSSGLIPFSWKSPVNDPLLQPDTGSSEHPRDYFHDTDAFQELKRRFGIRNRFWRKNYKRLKPGLNRLYDEALVSRYRPLTEAVLIAFEEQDVSLRMEIYAQRFTDILQQSRRLGPLYLEPDQNCQWPRKRKTREGPVILNSDGSPDLDLREQVLAYFEKGLELLEAGITEEALRNRLKEMIARFEEPPESAPISKMMNSTWMKVLSSLVPGFPLIGVILTEMDGGKTVNWKELGNRLLGRAAKEGANIGLRRILRYIRAPGAFLPVSFLLDQGMNRTELLGYLSIRVERKRKQLQDIAGPKKHL